MPSLDLYKQFTFYFYWFLNFLEELTGSLFLPKTFVQRVADKLFFQKLLRSDKSSENSKQIEKQWLKHLHNVNIWNMSSMETQVQGNEHAKLNLIHYQIGGNDEAHIYARAKVRVNVFRVSERAIYTRVMSVMHACKNKCAWSNK